MAIESRLCNCGHRREAPPDILLIVGDCVRADAILQDSPASLAQPASRLLGDQVVNFTHAVSTSSWTLPAHASLFTGRYPWEIGVIRATSRLDSSQDTIASIASRAGYRTAAFSSNPFVSQTFGLTTGFGTARAGSFLETGLRMPAALRRGPFHEGGPKLHGRLSDNGGRGSSLALALHEIAARVPGVLDIPVRAFNRLWPSDGIPQPLVSPWIEGSLMKWVAEQPASTPVFSFINFMDAHEPYVGLSVESSTAVTLRDYWNAIELCVRGEKRLDREISRESILLIENLYRKSIRVLEARIGELISNLGRIRDLSNTCIVFVGDHGQVFGEAGSLFHGQGTASGLFRVPLIVKPAAGSTPIQSMDGWVSTRRVFDIVGRAISECEQCASRHLEAHVQAREPAWALADLSAQSQVGTCQPRFGLIGFSDDGKVVIDPESGRMLESKDTDSPNLLGGDDSSTVPSVWRDYAQSVGLALTRKDAHTVPERIAGWGY